jgi:hypothetical protein
MLVRELMPDIKHSVVILQANALFIAIARALFEKEGDLIS